MADIIADARKDVTEQSAGQVPMEVNTVVEVPTTPVQHRALLVGGFNALVDAVNAHVARTGGPPPTAAIRAFQASQDLMWCYVADGHYCRLAEGARSTSLAVILNPDQTVSLASAPVAFQTTTDKDLVVIFIRIYSFTPRWGALLMLHELSHMADLRDGEDTSDPAQYSAGEVAAYDAETFAADASSQGQLTVALDAAVEALRKVEISLHDLVAGEGYGLIEQIHQRAFPDDPGPLSDREAGARHYFLLMALGLRAVRAGVWEGTQPGDVISLVHGHVGHTH